MNKPIDYYLGLAYTIELVPEPEGGWFVAVRELPGCMSEGETPEEAIAMIQDAMRTWIEASLEDDDPIPEPRQEDDYSGKFVVRVPQSLHHDLVQRAEREGVSLNQYINVALARSVGRLDPYDPATSEDRAWPGLQIALYRALADSGFAGEAGALDERLFAGSLDRCLAQVESALREGLVRDASQRLEELIHILAAGMGQSPVMAAFHRTAVLLARQVNKITALPPEIVHIPEH